MRKAEKVCRFSLFAFRFSVLVDRIHRIVSIQIGFGTVQADPTGQMRQLASKNYLYLRGFRGGQLPEIIYRYRSWNI